MVSPARRGFTISYMGKSLLSRIDPVGQGERLAADVSPKERTLYLFPSPLYGYGLSLVLEKIRRESQQKKIAILCVEADEKLFEISKKAFAELNIPTDDFPSLALTQISDPERICALIRETWGERVFRRLETIRLSGGWQLFPALYENIETAVRRDMALQWGNAMTLIRLGRLYTRNLIRNLALLPVSENIAALNFGSAPVLVLGAGPSLDPILNELCAFPGELERGKRRFRIICVDTCLPALLERSIHPDLVVILESQHWNLRDFLGVTGRDIDAALDLSALPASSRIMAGKRFLFVTPWTELELFKRMKTAGLLPETFPPLGSVGLSAVQAALTLSSGPVLIGGIDFSYTIDAYHARFTPRQQEQMIKQNRFTSIVNAAVFREGTFSVSAKNGKQVQSDPAMRRYRNLFEQEFALIRGGDRRLMDITGSGLPLGIKTVSLEDAIGILTSTAEATPPSIHNRNSALSSRQISEFIQNEIDTLNALKDILTGDKPSEPARLNDLLDTADYLWAHFPDCAGAGRRRPPHTDLGFLKRVRAEIEPFLKCWEMTTLELEKTRLRDTIKS